MKLEVNSAADFLMNLLRVKKGAPLPDDNQLLNFKGSLESLLVLRYRSHWYPDVPTKGSGYRCIRINGKMDPLIEQAGVACGFPPRILRKMLPTELTLWIDPEEVAYRIGENGSICVLYDSQSRASPSSDLDSTGSGSNLSSDEFIMERVGRTDMPEYLVRNPSSSTNKHFSFSPPMSSSLPNSTNSTPTKPTSAASINDGRFYSGYGGHSSPFQRGGGHKYHHQQPNHQFHRQPQQPHINGNNVNIHNQHQYMHQSLSHHQWDAFPNNNKVMCG